MNWLAHFALSPMDDRVLMGNWLADLFPRNELETISDPAIRLGLALHQVIDLTTDQHPRMKAALVEMPADLRRAGGIILDVIWDHCLSLEFTHRTGHSLDRFVPRVLDALERALPFAPAETATVLAKMREENWLGSYSTSEGVELALTRISRRLSPRARNILSPPLAKAFLETHSARIKEHFDVLWRDVSAEVAKSGLLIPPAQRAQTS